MQGLEKQTSEFELHPSGTREPKKDLCHLCHQMELRGRTSCSRDKMRMGRRLGDQGAKVKTLTSDCNFEWKHRVRPEATQKQLVWDGESSLPSLLSPPPSTGHFLTLARAGGGIM